MSFFKRKNDNKEMPFLDHLEELRRRLLICIAAVSVVTLGAFPFSGIFLNILTFPNSSLKEPAKLIFLKPAGMLMVRMEIALAAGLIVSLPVLFYEGWQFIAPGLLPHERRYVVPAIMVTTFCFLLGSAFAYFVLIPVVLPFLFSMGTSAIEATINITEYMSFVLRLILVSGLVFEFPILSFVLARIGILNPQFLKKYRRYSIVIIFIFAAVVTPPDPLSQIFMAIPMLILYEVSIWVAVAGSRAKKMRDNEKDAESAQTNP